MNVKRSLETPWTAMLPSKWQKLVFGKMELTSKGGQRSEMVGIPDCPCFWFYLTLRFKCVLAVLVVWTLIQ